MAGAVVPPPISMASGAGVVVAMPISEASGAGAGAVVATPIPKSANRSRNIQPRT